MTSLAGSKSFSNYGVRANCVAPGFIMEAEQVEEDYDALLKKIPLGRMGTPDEIADAVFYLLTVDTQLDKYLTCVEGFRYLRHSHFSAFVHVTTCFSTFWRH